ncbi:MAG: ammonium transporter [Anaerolineaceae bacterium]|nr:ammonium transporter [Anaerolineaceae bacterium]
MEALNMSSVAWVMVSAALVMVMLPGLSLFYSGLVRGKNALATAMHSFACLAIVLVVWMLWGYSLAFGPSVNGIIGNLDHIALNGVGLEPRPGQEIPELLFMLFQGMFAVITPALLAGALAERVKFRAFAAFVVIWVTFVYCPIAHWVWGDGWLHGLGALDFAGGFAVHISSGVAALAAAHILGRRETAAGESVQQPHSLMLVLLGTGLLWFGWFGFNGGSALAADGIAVIALVNTNVAAAAGALAWLLLSWHLTHKPSVLGAASGAVAGLVAITPAAGFVEPLAALIIGIGASVVSYIAAVSRIKAMVDDALDVWAIHGMSGTWGSLALGLFASTTLANGGLFTGNGDFFLAQVVGTAAMWIFAFVATWIVFKIIEAAIGLRTTPEEEALGLDVSEHGEAAYLFQ